MTRVMFTVKKMVIEYLKANGFNGLFNVDCECACDTEDLAPCGNIDGNCNAGYSGPCDCGDCDFHISNVKPDGLEVKCPVCNTTRKPSRYDGLAPEEFKWSVTCFSCALSGHGPTPDKAVSEFHRDSRRKLWLKDEYHRVKDSQGDENGKI